MNKKLEKIIVISVVILIIFSVIILFPRERTRETKSERLILTPNEVIDEGFEVTSQESPYDVSQNITSHNYLQMLKGNLTIWIYLIIYESEEACFKDYEVKLENAMFNSNTSYISDIPTGYIIQFGDLPAYGCAYTTFIFDDVMVMISVIPTFQETSWDNPVETAKFVTEMQFDKIIDNIYTG